MLLAGRGTELKAKLTQKGGKYLPTASVMKLMPAGTGSLNEVPTLERYLRTSGGNRELAIKQYSAAIRDVTRVRSTLYPPPECGNNTEPGYKYKEQNYYKG